MSALSKQPHTESNLPLDLALTYAERGWPVFPVYEIDHDQQCACGKADCESPGKHPRAAHGLKDATRGVEQIKTWWAEHPSANVGIRTGEASGLCVLDIDPRNGGDKLLTRLEEKYGKLPVSTIASTGGGGQHLFFDYPGSTMKSRSNALGGDCREQLVTNTKMLGPDASGLSATNIVRLKSSWQQEWAVVVGWRA